MSKTLALDIGGANIKVADGSGYAVSHPFALWKTPEQLTEKLAECLATAPPRDTLVVTMTGELCDCYETKREGVRHIVDATLKAAGNTPVLFYQTTGQFVPADEACEKYLLTAASNWHALATFATRFCDGKPGMLIDIGSTTTDIIPIENGREVALGRTDSERLGVGELVYQGVVRTPICALLGMVYWRGYNRLQTANELFTTSGDAYVLLGMLPEDPTNNDTADGKPFTLSAAHARMARTICGDRESVTLEEAQNFAHKACHAQLHSLEWAYGMVSWAKRSRKTTPAKIIFSGQGEFLAHELMKCQYVNYTGETVSLNELLGPDVSRCATAHALAVLASEIP
jgi:probable H4MPT-linked C1 transfer pathway protein